MQKILLHKLGFLPKENASGIFQKRFQDGYCIEVDFEKETFYFGGRIKIQGKDSQNVTKPEDWVVLECVNRLLEKGYKPENISLEKVYPAGHGTSGRLDICVSREDGSEYLLIECKTYGKEFDKEFTRMKKDGGQLFTYFKFSNKADIIMLYASELKGDKIVYKNEIVKIEDDYRTGDVKDFYDKWNKLTKDNGVFDAWVTPYHFVSKALTVKQLKPIRQEDSGFIFNRFLEILRHNVVSDKPNAFNKIFTLFLCKIYDEKVSRENDELKFQWLEGIDDDVSFQLRLTDLYKNGMKEFLDKKVTDFSENDFETKYASLFANDENLKQALKKDIAKLRLEKNNEFAIKEVFDEKSFNENAKVVKEVVELLQGFKIRYTKKQQYLSDFFELLLTTGLKQESGQFFTPVPVAQFIIKSIPLAQIIDDKLQKGERNNLLPYVIDYAAGSGHFLTESMHEIQRLIDKREPKEYIEDTSKKIKTWQQDHFDWALQYVYGIEKDYRLVKVGKVGCYLHGDGLANVIHSDGLGNFKETEEYKEKLALADVDFPKENKQFDVVISNPPYSVPAFKQNSRDYYTEKDFDLYSKLTDNSSEIECLFIERTKQLLKDGGVAGIILPSSILSNTGIYSKAREIILQYFDIIAITELGSNTFMATGTNTVTLFLRRRNNYESSNLRVSVDKFFSALQDVTLNGIEKPVSKYVSHVWEGISFADYLTLLQKTPNERIQNHEIYIEYRKKLKSKNEKEFWDLLLERENEKLYYFILAYPQRVVLVKSGEKDAEKRFLGYEFSNRRGSEGIHPIQRGKSIDECTEMFDSEIFDNPDKASTYIYKAFQGDFDFPVSDMMQKNITRHRLVDMLTFDRVEFEKNISLSIKKKVKIESKWEIKRLGDICNIFAGGDVPIDRFSKNKNSKFNIPIYSNGIENDGLYGFTDEPRVSDQCVTISARGTIGFTKQRLIPFYPIVRLLVLIPNKNLLTVKFLEIISNKIEFEQYAVGTPQLTVPQVSEYKIPLPPKDIQDKIVTEIVKLEESEIKEKDEIERLKSEIHSLLNKYPKGSISDICNVSDKRENPQNNFDIEYIYLGLEHIESNTGKITINREFGRKILSTKNIFEKGDILYGKLRPYLNKVAEPSFSGICSTDIIVLKTDIPKILKYLLLSEDLVKQTSDLMKGVSLPRIGIKDFLNQKISVPPLSEQQKIVSEIEKIEEQITELEKELAAIPAQKEEILKRYL